MFMHAYCHVRKMSTSNSNSDQIDAQANKRRKNYKSDDYKCSFGCSRSYEYKESNRLQYYACYHVWVT